jgi:hypothetical protein
MVPADSYSTFIVQYHLEQKDCLTEANLLGDWLIPLELFNQLGISSGMDVSDFHRGHGTFENRSSQWRSGSITDSIQVSETEEHTTG